jgi:hypothetical protein
MRQHRLVASVEDVSDIDVDTGEDGVPYIAIPLLAGSTLIITPEKHKGMFVALLMAPSGLRPLAIARLDGIKEAINKLVS